MSQALKKQRLGEHALPIALAGVGLWLAAALLVRALPGVFEGRVQTLIAMLLLFPAAEIGLRVLSAILGIERTKGLPAGALLGMIVVLCHGLALVLWPSLYGAGIETAGHGAAFVAWAGAAPVLCAWYAAERR